MTDQCPYLEYLAVGLGVEAVPSVADVGAHRLDELLGGGAERPGFSVRGIGELSIFQIRTLVGHALGDGLSV